MDRGWRIEPQPFTCLLMLCFLQINTNHSELHNFGAHDCQPAMNFSFAEKGIWFQQLRNQIVNSEYFHEFSYPATIGLSLEIGLGSTFFVIGFLVMYLLCFLAGWSSQDQKNLPQFFSQMNVWKRVVVLSHYLLTQLSIQDWY